MVDRIALVAWALLTLAVLAFLWWLNQPRVLVDSAAGAGWRETASFDASAPVSRPGCPKLVNPCDKIYCTPRVNTRSLA